VGEPIIVEARRGDVVEARHRVHAVAVRGEDVVVVAGEPELVTFLRSSAKPIQALPLVRARPDLDEEEIAIACASHAATPDQVAVVRRLLADAPAAENELECGPDPTPVEHNCSGKHAGFLALCRAMDWPSEGYRLARHPCQRAMRDEVARAAGVEPSAVPAAVDGCGVLTFALPLVASARMFGRLPELDGGERAVAAMRRHPELLRGRVAADVLLMSRLDGWAAKGGAEGLFCACSADGVGLALKVEDGSFRAILPAVAEMLRLLGIDPANLGHVTIESSHGEVVGAVDVAHASAI
jgi:L-asparaginase II